MSSSDSDSSLPSLLRIDDSSDSSGSSSEEQIIVRHLCNECGQRFSPLNYQNLCYICCGQRHTSFANVLFQNSSSDYESDDDSSEGVPQLMEAMPELVAPQMGPQSPPIALVPDINGEQTQYESDIEVYYTEDETDNIDDEQRLQLMHSFESLFLLNFSLRPTFDNYGSLPMSRVNVHKIPFVLISEEQVSQHISCSICIEMFNVDEKVRKLVCDHCFHDQCIQPWLKLHSNCPVCRQNLN